MEEENLKCIKEIFKDYNSSSFALCEARIKNINLHKKKNELELQIISDEPVMVVDLLSFCEYVEKRFLVENLNIKIKGNNIKQENILELINKQWGEIVKYLTRKHPMEMVILKNTSVELSDNALMVKLNRKGKEFLEFNGVNKKIEELLKNIYGISCKVEFLEEKNEKQSNKEKTQKRDQILSKTVLEIATQTAGTSENKKVEKTDKQSCYKQSNYKQLTNPAAIPNKNQDKIKEKNKNDVKENTTNNIEEESPLIYGRNQKINEPITKISDIGMDSGNVTISGKILKVELDAKDDNINLGIKTRELKNGKFLVIFSVYDGTNTINCKVFTQPDKLDNLTKRLKKAPILKVIGTAQFDPYAKELGILVNTIIEEPEQKIATRTDNAKVKRVELHMHTQMSTMDGITPAKDLIKRAMKWGMKSIAITDHGSVQAFPDAHKMLGINNPDMKVLYGVALIYSGKFFMTF